MPKSDAHLDRGKYIALSFIKFHAPTIDGLPQIFEKSSCALRRGDKFHIICEQIAPRYD